MSRSGDLGTSIADGADAAGEAISAAVDAVGKAAADLVETIGNGLAKRLHALAGRLGKRGTAGTLAGALSSWIGNLASALLQFVALTVRAALNLAGNLLAGLVRIVPGGIGGLLARDGVVFFAGLANIAEALLGALVATVAAFLALVQTLLLLQSAGRPLTRSERGVLRRVYRGSVRLDNVRIISGTAGLFSLSERPFTLGNRIYMKAVDSSERMDVLVHECGHVWQNQHEGTRYIGGALWAQWTRQNAYDWKAERGEGKSWRGFNREAQAQFIQDVFRYGRRLPAAGAPGEFFDDDPLGADLWFSPPDGGDLTAFARDSVTFVRSGRKAAGLAVNRTSRHS